MQLLLADIALILAYLRALVSAQNDVSTIGTALPPATTTKDVSAAIVGTATSSLAPATITITVSRVQNKFVPENITAQVGDIIKFEFWPTNNSVARSELGYPCIPYALTGANRAEAGFWSGFKPIITNLAQVNITELPAYYIVINRVTPLWFYNSAPGACIKEQMVGVINPGNPSQFALQQRAAAAATLALSPGEALPQGSTSLSSSNTATATSSFSTSSSSDANSAAKSSLSQGAIAGIAIAGLASVALVGMGVWLLRHWRKRHVSKQWRGKNDGGGVGGGATTAMTERSEVASELPGEGSVGSYVVSPLWEEQQHGRRQGVRSMVVSELSAYGDVRRDQMPSSPPGGRLPQLPERRKESPYEMDG